jgi:hypothetical protein
MMKLKTLLSTIIIALIMFSCSGNSIYYDFHKKGVVSCDGSPISTLSIIGTDKNSEFFYLTSNNGAALLSFNNIPSQFVIRDKKDNIISNEDFKLKSFSEYKISNTSRGDAAEQWVTIKTNDMGVIISADKINCD